MSKLTKAVRSLLNALPDDSDDYVDSSLYRMIQDKETDVLDELRKVEECEQKKIVLNVVGGAVYVVYNPYKLPIMVRDYDIDGIDEEEHDVDIKKDSFGRRYVETLVEEE